MYLPHNCGMSDYMITAEHIKDMWASHFEGEELQQWRAQIIARWLSQFEDRVREDERKRISEDLERRAKLPVGVRVDQLRAHVDELFDLQMAVIRAVNSAGRIAEEMAAEGRAESFKAPYPETLEGHRKSGNE